MGVGFDKVHDVEAESTREDQSEVEALVSKRHIDTHRHLRPRIADILTAGGSNAPLPVVAVDEVAHTRVLTLVVDTYLFLVGIERLPVLGKAVWVVGVLLAPFVKGVLVVFVHLLLRLEDTEYLIAVEKRHRVAVLGAGQERPRCISTFVDSGCAGFVAHLLDEVLVERHIHADAVLEVRFAVLPLDAHLVSLVLHQARIEIDGYGVGGVVGREIVTHTTCEAEGATVEHIARLAVIVVVSKGQTVVEEPEVDTGVHLVHFLPLEVFVAEDSDPCTRLPNLAVVESVRHTRHRIGGLVHILRDIVITEDTPRSTYLRIGEPVGSTRFLDEVLLAHTPPRVHRGEEAPTVLLDKTVGRIGAEIDREEVFALVVVVQTGKRRTATFLRDSIGSVFSSPRRPQGNRRSHRDGEAVGADREVVAVVFPPLGTNHRLKAVVAPTLVVGQHGVEHQFEVGARLGIQLTAVHAHLYGTEIHILGEIAFGVGTQRRRTRGTPSKPFDKLHIQVGLGIDVVVVVLNIVVCGFETGKVRSRTDRSGGLCVVAVLIKHLCHRHGTERHRVVVYRRIGRGVGLRHRTIHRLAYRNMLAQFVVEVGTERIASCTRIHIGTFLVEETERHKHLGFLRAATDGHVVFLLDTRTEHHFHPVGIRQVACARCA